MKKTTSQDLSKRLAQYGTLTLAMAGLMDANGQIVYTAVDPGDGTTNMNNFPIEIDLDNDTTHEFDVRLKYTARLYVFPNSTLTGASVLGNSLGGSLDNYDYPFALDNGFVISSGKTTWINNPNQIMVFNNCSYTGSDLNQWCDVTDKYLGLRFQILGATHYGWARLDVGDLPDTWILKDYAYNSVAGAPIMAGQTVLGVDDHAVSKVKIVALNKTIALFNLPQATDYSVYTMAGKLALDGKITNSSKYSIEANTLSTGVYIIELRDLNSNAVVRKKIVL
jgi:hypothetical protein